MFKGRSVQIIPLTGKYEINKHENMEAFLKETGIPDNFAKHVMQLGTTVDIVDEGNKYSMATSFELKLEFTLNEEYEEPMFKGLKSIATRDGNVLSMTSKFPDGSTCVRSYEFTDKIMIAVMTKNGVTAKRYYTRL